MFQNMSPWCILQIKGAFFLFFKNRLFCEEISNLISEFQFKIKAFEVKMISKVTKSNKIILIKDGVKWTILKKTKIRDQGMENPFFMLRFKLCTTGVCFEIRTCFFCFQI